MKENKRSLVELALLLGFKKAASHDSIYSDGIVIISSVGEESRKLERKKSKVTIRKMASPDSPIYNQPMQIGGFKSSLKNWAPESLTDDASPAKVLQSPQNEK